ncbi:Uncharacterised protein [Vibrio cholerae]|nr:Uncharacterised protein [Vibrio cholerae]
MDARPAWVSVLAYSFTPLFLLLVSLRFLLNRLSYFKSLKWWERLI